MSMRKKRTIDFSRFHEMLNLSQIEKKNVKKEKKNHRKQNHFEKLFEDISEFSLCKKNNDIYVENKFN